MRNKKMKNKGREVPVIFQNKRKKQLIGILHIPAVRKPPLVIICHGFDGKKTQKRYVEMGRALSKEGIATFRFDFEGCGDSEGKFEDMTVEREASDLNEALKTVLKAYDIDSNKIVLFGHSLGAVVVSLFFKKYGVPIKALIFTAPAFNQQKLFKIWHTRNYIQRWQRNGFLIMGETKLGRNYFQENRNKDWSSLLSQISRASILLIHGERDKDVPLKFSKELAKRNKNITIRIIPEADHDFAEFNVRKKLIKAIISWLKGNL